jgi:CheY-like chemotaxis protein
VRLSEWLDGFETLAGLRLFMHIIIADDDPITRQILSKMLARFGSVDEATDGAEALAALETALSWGAPPDLICLDARMRCGGGVPALHLLRILEESMCLRGAKRAKVLMLVSSREGAGAIEAFREADGYLNRPVTAAQLNEQMQKLGLL